MEQLSYKKLAKDLPHTFVLQSAPEKVLQFGEGNFLRGFVDCFIDMANEQGVFHGKVVVVQPIEIGMVPALNQQQGLYT